MPKSDYLAANDTLFAAQLTQFASAIPAYAASLGVTPTEVAAQAADAAYFQHVLSCQSATQATAQQWTGWKNIVRTGEEATTAGAPLPATLPAAPTAIPPGVEARFRALVRKIKAAGNYNAATGEALGIEAPEQTGPDLDTLQPVIFAVLSGGRVTVDWNWQNQRSFLDMIEIQVDRSDTRGFVLLTYDTTPGYNDTTPLPTTPSRWTYRAIYRVADQQVGQWSKPVSITVG